MNPFSVPLRCMCISYKSRVYFSSPSLYVIIRKNRSLIFQTLLGGQHPNNQQQADTSGLRTFMMTSFVTFYLNPTLCYSLLFHCPFECPSHLCTNQNGAQLFLLLSGGVTKKNLFSSL